MPGNFFFFMCRSVVLMGGIREKQEEEAIQSGIGLTKPGERREKGEKEEEKLFEGRGLLP